MFAISRQKEAELIGEMMKVIKTERLILRPFTINDLEDIYRLVYSDPEVSKYYCGGPRSLQETKEGLAYKIYQLKDSNFGFLAIILKENQTLIGLCALQNYLAFYIVFEDAPDDRYNSLEVELSYALGRDYWGKGYATEAGKALIEYAFKELRIKRIAYAVDSENVKSINLMKRLGFRLGKNLHPDWPGVTGILENNLI